MCKIGNMRALTLSLLAEPPRTIRNSLFRNILPLNYSESRFCVSRDHTPDSQTIENEYFKVPVSKTIKKYDMPRLQLPAPRQRPKREAQADRLEYARREKAARQFRRHTGPGLE
jgi:hypothetical protein